MLVPLLLHAGEECVLLTKRPESLTRYAGQVALPGGAREAGDRDLRETALRETEEEVGIPRGDVEIVGELSWHETTLRHRVKPFVGRVRGPADVRPDPAEVEAVLYLPTRRLTPELFGVRGRFHDASGREHIIYTFPHEGHEVWGLTARILRELAGELAEAGGA